jgi:hypothetical protein
MTLLSVNPLRANYPPQINPDLSGAAGTLNAQTEENWKARWQTE